MRMIDICRSLYQPKCAANNYLRCSNQGPLCEARSNKRTGHDNVFHMDIANLFLNSSIAITFNINDRNRKSLLDKGSGLTHHSRVVARLSQYMHTNPEG